MPYLLLTMAMILAADLYGAAASATVTFGDEHCMTIRFSTGWWLSYMDREPAPVDRFEFRVNRGPGATMRDGTEYLIAAVNPTGSEANGPIVYSANKFLVNLSDAARVRAATQEQWDAATAVQAEELFTAWIPNERREEDYVFQGRAFH